MDLEVRAGENLAIIGPNGAGKTTFINICTGYLRPGPAGSIFEVTTSPAKRPRAITRRGIGRTFQLPQLFTEHTVLENSCSPRRRMPARGGLGCACCGLHRRRRPCALWSCFGIADARRGTRRRAARGHAQAADVAMAVALQPQADADGRTDQRRRRRREVRDHGNPGRRAARRGVTAVFVEHDMDMVAPLRRPRRGLESGPHRARRARPRRCCTTLWCCAT